MTRVIDNWERLVKATLLRQQLRITGISHERKSSGLASAVPDSLQRTTYINAILQAADEIQPEDDPVARILCEQAYSMTRNLDPNSEGRGVFQFKAGLMAVIKDGRTIDRNWDAQHLWNFYQHYKRKHRVNEIQKEEPKMPESGTFSADMGLRSQETKKVFTTLRALVEVLEVLIKEGPPDGVGKYLAEEVLFEIKMTKVFDNWERLVRGALRREQLRLTRKTHELATSINVMLQGADEIQSEDAQVARILCEQAYTMAQRLDPSSEGRGALQFNAGISTVIKQKLAKMDGRTIDRHGDVQRLWNFYQHYKRKHKVDEIQKEEHKMLQSGIYSADIGLTEKVHTVLRAFVAAMEALNEDDLPDEVGRDIAEELKRLKLEDGNKTDGKEVKLEDVDKQGKEEGAGKQLSRKNSFHKGSTSRPKEWQYLEISLEEIKQAAKNFQDCIGKGGYGLVYKGKLYKSGKPIPVAIKRLNEQFGQGLKEFLTEIQLLYGKKHPNLISLLGYCEEDKEKILVYEYAKRGSLDQYLRRDNTTNYTLTWHQRLKICAGAARGLAHLHNHVGKNIRIIHRDIKSANILLDKNWVAKISDFGLSKLSLAGLDRSAVISHPCGTMGYCEPEYMITGILTKESDVYSFGIVLFEVLCGRLCGIKDNDGTLLSGPLVKEFYERKRLEEIIDPSLKEHFSSDSVNKFSEIAYRCLHYDRKQRPPMDLVVKELEDLLEMEPPQVITVVLKVNMHCEACAQEIRKRILRMKGVESAEPDLKASEVSVKGTFTAPALVDYIHKRTGKQAVIVKQDPEPKKEEEKPKEEKKDDGGEKKEEKKDAPAGGAEEKDKDKDKDKGKEEKKDGGGEEAPKPEGGPPASVDEMNVVELRKNEFYYYHPQNYQVYPARYTAESSYGYPPAPQMFSDENPNACSAM